MNSQQLQEYANRKRAKIRELCRNLAAFFGCEVCELEGQTIDQLFNSAEKMGATVYWGCWSDSELATVVSAIHTN